MVAALNQDEDRRKLGDDDGDGNDKGRYEGSREDDIRRGPRRKIDGKVQLDGAGTGSWGSWR